MPGVGNVNVFGVGQYSMRIWLDPQKLQRCGLAAAGRDQRDPAAEPVGDRGPGRHAARRKDQNFQYTVDIQGRLDDPSQFANIIVKVRPPTADRSRG